MGFKTRSILFTVLALVALLGPALGALPLAAAPGPEYQQIVGNVTWSGNSSIDTDVVVTNGATLHIDGTALVYASNFENGTAYPGGLNPYKIEIIVEDGGYLQIETGAQLIANAAGDWYGVVFLPGSDGLLDSPLIRNGIVGVTILGDASPTVMGCTIQDMRGISPGFPPGSAGEMAAGIVVSGTSSAQVLYNIITNIQGGNGTPGQDGSAGLPGGGDGGAGTAGGEGGWAYGIYVAGGATPTVRGNTISNLAGGSGGDGGSGGAGGDGGPIVSQGGQGGGAGGGRGGGTAVGIMVENDVPSTCLVQENSIADLFGGAGGRGGDGGAGGAGWDCAGSGGNGGNGGNGGGGGTGGTGSPAYGILVGNASPTVRDNVISGVLVGGVGGSAGSGGSGGNGGSGCAGSAGEDGGAGGSGGNAANGGLGGSGGSAIGISIQVLSTADVRHNALTATIRGGVGADGGGGGNGGAGGDGGDGGDEMSNQSGHGGNGGSGGYGGYGREAGAGGDAFGIYAGGTPTVARNRVTSLVGGTSVGTGGLGGSGGAGGNGGEGGTGPFPGNGGTGGRGGDGLAGGAGAPGGYAAGIFNYGSTRIENNLLHSFGGGAGTTAGAGGVGGNGGNGGDAGNANAQAGNGGNGGNGGDGNTGGSSGPSYGLKLNDNAEVVNNTVNNMGTNTQPGAGSSGGQGGLGGNPGTIGLPGTPGGTGGTGTPGAAGDEGSAYGLYLATDQPTIVNNIVTATGVGQRGGAASSYGISSSVGPLTLELDYNDVWGWASGNYYDVTPGANDLSQDPLFVDVNTGDYHLQAGSPCRNSGTSSFGGLTLPTDDLDGSSRPQGSAYDIGAYEYVETVCTPVTGVTISGPTTGLVGVPYGFGAAVVPANATAPIEYTWTPAPGGGQGTANASYTWSAAGTYNVGVAVSNCGGAGTGNDDHSIVISVGAVYQLFLPLVERP